MKKIFTIFVVAVLIASCTKEYEISTMGNSGERDYLPKPTRTEVDETEEGLMVFGPQLTNPFALSMMQQARTAVLSEYSDLNIPELTASHYYVRFAPQNDDELYALVQDTTICFYEYPLDREIISGTYYHDPEIADSLPTYQYTSIPKAKWDEMSVSTTIDYTVLEELFIPDEAGDFIGDGGNDDGNDDGDDDGGDGDGGLIPEIGGPGTIIPVDSTIFIPIRPGDDPIGPNNSGGQVTNLPASFSVANLLNNKAFRLAGLESASTQLIQSSTWNPSGRITAYDDIVGGPVPLVGVKVRARRWFTTSTATTDSDGNFVCLSSFKRPVNYCIIWESNKWDIRDGRTNQAYFNGPKQKGAWIQYIDGGKSLAYSALHRALYRIYYKYNSGLTRPDYNKIKVQYLHKYNEGVRGAFPASPGNNPKVQIWGKDETSESHVPSLIFSTLCHEVGGHGVHIQNCSSYTSLPLRYVEAWAIFAQFYLTYTEYNGLAALRNLNVYSMVNPNINLDQEYNFQGWTKYAEPSSPRYEYPPIFVDVYDDFNQCDERYDLFYYMFYPTDNVKYAKPASLQNIVFENSSFAGVKTRLLELYSPNDVLTNYTISSLNELFEYYEY